MARCEDCGYNQSGSMGHADFCKYNIEETKEKYENLQVENEAMKALLQKYSDRCPCKPGAPCDLCDEASAYL